MQGGKSTCPKKNRVLDILKLCMCKIGRTSGMVSVLLASAQGSLREQQPSDAQFGTAAERQ